MAGPLDFREALARMLRGDLTAEDEDEIAQAEALLRENAKKPKKPEGFSWDRMGENLSRTDGPKRFAAAAGENIVGTGKAILAAPGMAYDYATSPRESRMGDIELPDESQPAPPEKPSIFRPKNAREAFTNLAPFAVPFNLEGVKRGFDNSDPMQMMGSLAGDVGMEAVGGLATDALIHGAKKAAPVLAREGRALADEGRRFMESSEVGNLGTGTGELKRLEKQRRAQRVNVSATKVDPTVASTPDALSPTAVDVKATPVGKAAKSGTKEVAIAPVLTAKARAKQIAKHYDALDTTQQRALAEEISRAFPILDDYTKTTHPILPKRIAERAAELSPDAQEFLATVTRGADPKRPISPSELQSLAAGEPYEPPRLIRPPLASNYNMARTRPGAPLGVTTRAKEAKHLESYLSLAEEGADGALWYDKGGASMLFHTGDPEQARRLAALHSVTSPSTEVGVNSGFAVKGWNQQAVGDAINTGRYPTAMSKEAEDIFTGTSDLMSNRKRGPFYDALMRRGGFGNADTPLRPTNDIWQAEAWGYAHPDGTAMREGFGPKEHAWMDRMTQEAVDEANRRGLGGRTDWTLDRLQAASWFGAKKRARLAVGKKVEPYSDFATGLEKNYGQGSRENAPSDTASHLTGLSDDPQLLQQHADEVYKATHNEQGQDLLSLGAGGLTGTSTRGPGVFEGQVSPGVQTRLSLGTADEPHQLGPGLRNANAPTPRTIDPSSMKLLDAVESSYALMFGQKASAGGRFFNSPVQFRNAIGVKLGRVPTDAEFLKLAADLKAAGMGDRIAQIFDPLGYTLKDFMGPTTPDSEKVLRGIAEGIHGKKNVKIEGGRHSGPYVENDWSQEGQQFGQRFFEPIRPIRDKFDQYAPAIAKKAREIDKHIAELSGGRFILSDNIDYLRQTIENEGYAGLERIAKQFGISAVVLASAASALGLGTATAGAAASGKS